MAKKVLIFAKNNNNIAGNLKRNMNNGEVFYKVNYNSY